MNVTIFKNNWLRLPFSHFDCRLKGNNRIQPPHVPGGESQPRISFILILRVFIVQLNSKLSNRKVH